MNQKELSLPINDHERPYDAPAPECEASPGIKNIDALERANEPQPLGKAESAAALHRFNAPGGARPPPPPIDGSRETAQYPEQHVLSCFDLHQRALKSATAPSLIVDAAHNILHLSEDAGRFLRHVGGELSCSVLKLIQPEMRLEMCIALFRAQQSGAVIKARPVRFIRKNRQSLVQLAAHPYQHSGSAYTLVMFEEVDVVPAEIHSKPILPEAQGKTLNLLERELQQTKLCLQTAIEQFELAQKKMLSDNQQLQEINAELRLTNEVSALETIELTSINSALLQANEALARKVEAGEKINAHLARSTAAVDIATVFLDCHRHIQWFTPRTQDIFNILPEDVGRSILDITHCLNYDNLAQDTARAIESLKGFACEVSNTHGQHYIARFTPLHPNEHQGGGAVLTFVEMPRLRAHPLQRYEENPPLHSITRGEACARQRPDEPRCNNSNQGENGRLSEQNLTRHGIDLARMLADLQQRMAARCCEIHLSLQLPDPGQQPMMIDGDPDDVEWIILSMIDSALRVIPSGKLRLIVNYDAAMVELNVQENALVMSADTAQGTLDPGPGTIQGAGPVILSRTRDWLLIPGGSLKGTAKGSAVFSVRLPLAEAQEPCGTHTRSTEHVGRLAGISIFLVEDSPEVLEALKLLLEAEDAQVIAYTEPLVALKAAQRCSFDVIICDLKMPHMSGFDLMRALRGLPHAQRIPAIALSSYGAETDVENSLLSGFDRHIHKPFSHFDALIDTIETLRRTQLH
ncbi:response regulator [Pseudomonas sp. MDT1-17]